MSKVRSNDSVAKINAPLPLDIEPTPDEIKRFMEKVSHDKTSSHGCWLWTAHKDEKGYGQFRLRGTTHWAHRVSYALFRRPLIGGFTIEHKCRNPSCVNPWHLELLTNSENAALGNTNRAEEECPF